MILEIITGIVRALLAGYGGKLVESGLISADDLSKFIGAVLVVISIVWSAWKNRQNHIDKRALADAAFDPSMPVKKAVALATGASQVAAGVFRKGGFARPAMLAALLVFPTFVLLGGTFVVNRYAEPAVAPQMVQRAVSHEDPRPFLVRFLASLRLTGGLAVTGDVDPDAGHRMWITGGARF